MKTIQWFLLLSRCHFQPSVTFGHSWLQMTPRERQKPFHFLRTSDGKQMPITLRLKPFQDYIFPLNEKSQHIFISMNYNGITLCFAENFMYFPCLPRFRKKFSEWATRTCQSYRSKSSTNSGSGMDGSPALSRYCMVCELQRILAQVDLFSPKWLTRFWQTALAKKVINPADFLTLKISEPSDHCLKSSGQNVNF